VEGLTQAEEAGLAEAEEAEGLNFIKSCSYG